MSEITTGGRTISVGNPEDAWKQCHPEMVEATPSHAAPLPPHAFQPPPLSPYAIQAYQADRDAAATYQRDVQELQRRTLASAPSSHVVILGGVGEWMTRGQVVHVNQFPPGTDFSRLVRLKAVRPANEQEQGQERITAEDPLGPQNRGVEILLQERDREIDTLRHELFTVKDQLRALQSREQSVRTPDPEMNIAARQAKDSLIEQLRTQLQAKTAECDRLKEQADAGAKQQQPPAQEQAKPKKQG